MFIPPSELIINPDNSVYHLKVKPDEIADIIITVGDPNRVNEVIKHLDQVHLERVNREFKTVTGVLNGKALTVISTGIGTDNIDIVLNELDALANIDFRSRTLKSEMRQLTFVRIGTSGTIREEIPIDSTIISKYAIGFEGLLHYYDSDSVRIKGLESQCNGPILPYAVKGDDHLVSKFSKLGNLGITFTASGFYAPQSRQLRLKSQFDYKDYSTSINYDGLSPTNLEMETAGIYGLAALMGHRAVSLNAILANRVTNEFSSQPGKTVEKLIAQSLEIIDELTR